MSDHTYSLAGPSWREAGIRQGITIEREAQLLLDKLECGNISDISDIENSDEEYECEILPTNVPNRDNLQTDIELEPTESSGNVSCNLNEHVLPHTPKANIQWQRFSNVQPPTGVWEETNLLENSEPADPITYFKRYITDTEINKLVEMTNIYALQQGDTAFKPTTKKEMEILIGLHVAMGVFKLPRIKLYWDKALGITLFKDSMTRNRFYKLRRYLHITNNLERDDSINDTFHKVRTLINAVLNRCKQLTSEKRVCVDEQIIPFKGQHSAKQYVKGKPHPWGIKIFVLCGESGLMHNFLIYQGKNTEITENLLTQYGLGASVVIHLCKDISKPGTHMFFDNFFTTYHLLQALKGMSIFAAGTARVNRFSNPPFISDKEMKKKGRGAMHQLTSTDNDVVAVRWYDNKPVTMASNFVGVGETGLVSRWDKTNKTYVDVEQPEVIRQYNASMGGVDKLDFLMAIYRTFIRSRKWPLRIIFHFIDLAICNSWIEYRTDCTAANIEKKKMMDLLHFRMSVVESLVNTERTSPSRKRGRPSLRAEVEEQEMAKTSKGPEHESRPSILVRADTVDHLPIHCEKKEAGRCKNVGCSGRSNFCCEKCQVYLCLSKNRNCFRSFHTS